MGLEPIYLKMVFQNRENGKTGVKFDGLGVTMTIKMIFEFFKFNSIQVYIQGTSACHKLLKFR